MKQQIMHDYPELEPDDARAVYDSSLAWASTALCESAVWREPLAKARRSQSQPDRRLRVDVCRSSYNASLPCLPKEKRLWLKPRPETR